MLTFPGGIYKHGCVVILIPSNSINIAIARISLLRALEELHKLVHDVVLIQC